MKSKTNNQFAEAYRFMMDFTVKLYGIEDMRDVLAHIVDQAAKLIHSDRCTLYLYDEVHNELYSEFYYGERVKQIRLALDNTSIAGYCGNNIEIINIPDVYADLSLIHENLRFNSHFDEINQYQTRSMLSVPLVDNAGKLLGVLSLINKINSSCFDELDESLLSGFGQHAAIAIHRLQRKSLATVFSEEEQQLFKGSKDVFVVFFDIIGYTTLSEILGDKSIKKILKYWEEEHIQLLNQYGGIYVKSAGDEVMSLFGLAKQHSDYHHSQTIPPLANDDSIETFIAKKEQLDGHENLAPLIFALINWIESKQEQLSKRMLNNAQKVLQMFWAENVVRFMYRAQKKLDWLNKFLYKQGLISSDESQRIYMKGGTEFGSAIVDFDIYGRIDVIGDVVNVASRVTGLGNTFYSAGPPCLHPILVGEKFIELLPKGFVNTTMNRFRLKGKEISQSVYSIDSIISKENRIKLPNDKFETYSKYIQKQIQNLGSVKQKALPFNYASYLIEKTDKYKVDHSWRVAITSLHIIELINTDLNAKIDYEQSRIDHYLQKSQDLESRIKAIQTYQELHGRKVPSSTSSEKLQQLTARELLDQCFSIKDIEAWQKKHQLIIQKDYQLNECFIHEFNLFQLFVGKATNKSSAAILKEVLRSKVDTLNDSIYNIEQKKRLISFFQKSVN